MKLTNFVIERSGELSGLGQRWDLHNSAEFKKLEYRHADSVATLAWAVTRHQGFSGVNPARSCTIRFIGVTSITLSGATAHSVVRETSTLNEISWVAPLGTTPAEARQAGIRVPPAQESEGHLLFRFTDGREIEIGAQTATLEAAN